MGRIALWALLAGLVAGACSGDSSDDAVMAPEVSEDSTSAVDERPVIRLLVVGSSPETVALIEKFAALGVAGEMLVLGNGPCPSGVVCAAEAPAAGETSESYVVVSLGGTGSISALGSVLAGASAVVVVGDPGDESTGVLASELGGVPVRVVPGNLGHELSSLELALWVGARDDVAAYESVEVISGAFVSVVHTVLDDRVELLRNPMVVEEPELVAVPEPTVRWTRDVPASVGGVGRPHKGVLVNGLFAFLGNDGVVRGLDAGTGAEVWATPIVLDLGSVRPATFASVGGNTVLVGMGSATVGPDAPAVTLFALDSRTGVPLWSNSTIGTGAVGSPATDGERVYVWFASNSEDQALRALDLRSGEELWRLDATLGIGPLRVESGVIWTGNRDGILLAVDSASGEEIGRFETAGGNVGGLSSRPVLDGELVMFGSDLGTFFAVDRDTFEVAWRFDAELPELPSSPLVAGDLVVFGANLDGAIYALDSVTGDLRWTYSDLHRVISSPVNENGVIYFGSHGDDPAVHAVDAATGEAIWLLPVDEGVDASPVLDDELIYIYTPSRVYAIER